MLPDKKYQIIYADPPWKYRDQGRKLHYTRQEKDWICNLPVQNILEENCFLFLWATMPLLPESLEVIEKWGFQYKTSGFVWIKRNKKTQSTWFWGMGNWTRANSELCLLATKGKPKRVSAAVHSVVDTPIEKHSKKPDVVKDRIVQLCGDLPRIELFARQKTIGWDSWGNEV
jgi:N6-adenosine-specific RNA methylase IME4